MTTFLWITQLLYGLNNFSALLLSVNAFGFWIFNLSNKLAILLTKIVVDSSFCFLVIVLVFSQLLMKMFSLVCVKIFKEL